MNNTKKRRVSNILFEISDKVSLRIEKYINVGFFLLNWDLFDRIACTVVLFNSPCTVTQRNLERRLKYRQVSCHNTSMMRVWEVWSYIENKEHWVLPDAYQQKWYYFFCNETLSSKTQRKGTISVLTKLWERRYNYSYQIHIFIERSSDLPCWRPSCWPALKIHFIIQGDLIYL